MAHIAACLLDSDGEQKSSRVNTPSPVPPYASTDSLDMLSVSSSEERKLSSWRMHNSDARKYQLFPRERQAPQAAGSRQLDPEQAFAVAMGQTGDKSDKGSPSSGLRLRIKEHNMIRRRKVSVPELGPMTTVQEVAMDSPTIPGRPPLHERSISSPVNTLRQHNLAESTAAADHARDELTDVNVANTLLSVENAMSMSRRPMSPKSLAPLVIPAQGAMIPRLARQLSLNRLRSGSVSHEPGLRSARTDDSPKARTPYTPLSASAFITTPKTAPTMATAPNFSTAPTAGMTTPGPRESPTPWDRPGSTTPVTGLHGENDAPSRSGTAMSHRRGRSDSSSIMERGRPRKRSDGALIGQTSRSASKRSKSAERRAFEHLPTGWKSGEALKILDAGEVASLQKQALEQAFRFEVLRKEDVEDLSKELRHLDERTEYLRRTYTSLRAGRRNLHSRICQYLRSPRTAKFSQDSMLKQEEALAELDASIDDWVNKLEKAENRRTRVRQKLLEHVAAAATLSLTADIIDASETLHQALGIRQRPGIDITTPPRSPTKVVSVSTGQSPSSSPHRVVARVPSVIHELPAEEAATVVAEAKEAETEATIQKRMESIRIYADSDVYALLADVENEFTRLSKGVEQTEPSDTKMTDHQKRELHRARSHDVLSNSPVRKTADKATPVSPPAPSPPSKDTPPATEEHFFLTAAVFQP